MKVEAPLGQVVGAWDARRIERVLDNLLSNAVKYSPDGGDVAVVVTREGGDHPSAVISIRDGGLGIPADDLSRIFEPFHRGSNVAESIPGAGIGLAGSLQIVVQHGGTISVDSRDGGGSTFTVRLPLAAAAQEVGAAAS